MTYLEMYSLTCLLSLAFAIYMEKREMKLQGRENRDHEIFVNILPVCFLGPLLLILYAAILIMGKRK